eukprot:58353-Pleurochrysis_carterae.AAC.1
MCASGLAAAVQQRVRRWRHACLRARRTSGCQMELLVSVKMSVCEVEDTASELAFKSEPPSSKLVGGGGGAKGGIEGGGGAEGGGEGEGGLGGGGSGGGHCGGNGGNGGGEDGGSGGIN